MDDVRRFISSSSPWLGGEIRAVSLHDEASKRQATLDHLSKSGVAEGDDAIDPHHELLPEAEDRLQILLRLGEGVEDASQSLDTSLL